MVKNYIYTNKYITKYDIYVCVYLFIKKDILSILINEKKSSVKQYE